MSKDAPPPPERLAEIEAVTQRAQTGDRSAVPRLRELMEEFPLLGEYFGDLASQATGVWVALAAGSNLYLRESLARKVDALRRELTGGSPNPVLGLLVDRVILTWLAANYHTSMEGTALDARENPRLLAFRSKRRVQSERAHLTALAALVTLRKLLPPASEPAAATTGRVPPLPRHADARDVTNRLSEYFAELSFPPTAVASKEALAAVN